MYVVQGRQAVQLYQRLLLCNIFFALPVYLPMTVNKRVLTYVQEYHNLMNSYNLVGRI